MSPGPKCGTVTVLMALLCLGALLTFTYKVRLFCMRIPRTLFVDDTRTTSVSYAGR